MIAPTPVTLKPLSTYSRDTTTFNYTYRTDALISGGSSTKSLGLRVYRPVGLSDYNVPRPCMIWINNGGFTLSGDADDALAQGRADLFAPIGGITVFVETRVVSDDPVSDGDAALGILGDQKARAITAAMEDTLKAYQWVTGVRSLGGNWSVDPKWVFIGGHSAGGITPMLAMLKWPWMTLAGIIQSAAAYGLANDPDYDTDIRTTLGYTENDLDGSQPPVCAFLGGNDTIIGTTNISNLKTKLEALGGDNIVHWDADGAHTSVEDFPNGDVTGASSVQEALKKFMDTRIAAIPRSMGLYQFT